MHKHFIITLILLTLNTSYSKTLANAFKGLSCNVILSDVNNLDTVVELTTQGDHDSEFSIRTLHSYIIQTSPNFLATDYERIIHYIFKRQSFTYHEEEPSSMWHIITRSISRGRAEANIRVQRQNLSLESQIFIWLLNRYLNQINSLTNAVLVGRIHRYILNDISRLQPNRDQVYYQSVLNSVLN